KQVSLRLKGLKGLDLALRHMVLRLGIERLQGSLRRITYKHILELDDLLDDRRVGSRVDLPQGISVVKSCVALRIYKRKRSSKNNVTKLTLSAL
ncbi:MAG: TilS substrate-binding domain-containing protein, partial [Candidatus Omnitrophota bacterium]